MTQTASVRRKTQRTESFPVAWLLPGRIRNAVNAFYRFARTADNIADSPVLTPSAKLELLAAMRDVPPRGTEQMAHDLIRAFERDASGEPIETWESLIEYCRLSAVPVGRFLLDLFEERTPASEHAADALCCALQILNHVEGCATDWRDLHRLYLPQDWIREEGGSPDDLGADHCSVPLRRVLDRLLQEARAFLLAAAPLAYTLRNRSLRAQAVATLAVAHRHCSALERKDPLQTTVRPSAWDWMAAGGAAVLALIPPGKPPSPPPSLSFLVEQVRATGSSFYWTIRLMPREQRFGMASLYLFCRAIDDIADGSSSITQKRLALEAWQAAFSSCRIHEVPSSILVGPLSWTIERWKLPLSPFLAIIEGCAMDVSPSGSAPPLDDLKAYCGKVAGAVGLILVRILGINDGRADRFALATGEALQYVNIARDVVEDARNGRVYLPAPVLVDAGIDVATTATDLAVDPRLPLARRAFSGMVEQVLSTAWREWYAASLTRDERRRLRPALMMLVGYQSLFCALRRGHFEDGDKSWRCSKARLAVLMLWVRYFGVRGLAFKP